MRTIDMRGPEYIDYGLNGYLERFIRKKYRLGLTPGFEITSLLGPFFG